MSIRDRIVAAEERFTELEQQRQAINEEMLKLQGEWRVLTELEATENPKKPNKKATVIEAVPEEQ